MRVHARRALAVAYFIVGNAMTLGAQASGRALTIEDYYRVLDVGAPQMSPDGRFVAFTVSRRIEATNGDLAIDKALNLVRELTRNDTEGIHLPLSEPGDHDTDAIIYPSLDVKDYRIADVESL